MRFSSFTYLVGQGLHNLKANKMMTLASMGVLIVCMILVGAAFLFGANIDSMVAYIGEQNETVAFINDDADTAAVEEAIRSIPHVAGVEFISKDQMLDKYSQRLEGYTNLKEMFQNDNPLLANYVVRADEPANISSVAAALQNVDGVRAVNSPQAMSDLFVSLQKAVTYVCYGLVIVLAVEFFDKVAKIDDPVGAISVHGVCGALGTILTGLFATGVSTEKGGFYGGGFHFFGVQCLGVASVILYVAVVITIVFAILKHTIGLRVTPEEEITGLDVSEHGLLTAYAGFAMLPDTAAVETDAPVAVTGSVPAAEAIPVKRVPSFDTADGTAPKFTKVEIICKESKFEALKTAMLELGITGMTMSHVLGCGIQKGKPEYYRGVEVEPTLLPKIQLDIVVSKVPVRSVIETAKKVLYTGHIGDGKIFVYDVENVVKVRTGEEGYDALQDVE